MLFPVLLNDTGDRLKTVAIIQARMDSSRLPGKVLADISGRPLLSHLLARVKKAETPDLTVVATGELPKNLPIITLAQSMGVATFSGSTDDVLGRYLGAAIEYQATTIVRITADNPLTCPEIIDGTVSEQIKTGADLVLAHPVVNGSEVEVMSIDALKKSARQAKKPSHREHATMHMKENKNQYKVAYWAPPVELQRPDIVIGVDTQEELDRLRTILSKISPENNLPSLLDVVRWLNKYPDELSLSSSADLLCVKY